ncbi:MAG: hypothetical protein LUF34_10040 [Lachnospiraceae bacterium]|nr:hypothetical protein [Lachnospiraceae bacterium]
MGRMKFDLATNFDEELLQYLEKVDQKQQVISLFGKLKSDPVGGGRASVALSDVSLEQIEQYNRRCQAMGIHLNYLLNPLTLNNQDVVAQEHRELMKFVGILRDIGIEWITVCSPYLLNLVKKQFPHMKVTVGVYAYVGSLSKAKSWIDMGADEITLTESCTRNFAFLERILKMYCKREVNFRLIANNGCLHECPYALNHAGTVSASSRSGDSSRRGYYDVSLVGCYSRKLSKPANMIASDWIRPEDLHFYEELCEKTGNNRLIIKLVERTKSTKFLKNVLDAYLQEKYERNLLDLMNWIGNDTENRKLDLSGYMEALRKGELDGKTLIQYSSFLQLPDLYIDNKKLDGFMEHFIHNYACDRKSCWLEEGMPEEGREEYCFYCREWAKRVVSVPQGKEYERWLRNADELKESFNNSRLFPGGSGV